MATDATGTPTSPDGIPKFNTSVDAPSGLGTNAMMDAIQAALSSRPSTPAGIAAGEAMIWNGTAFVRSSVTKLSISSLSGFPNDVSEVLRGDGTWGTPRLASGSRAAVVSTAGTTFAAGADLLASALSFTADGTSSYAVRAEASDWQNSGVNANFLRLNLDGADAGHMAIWNCPLANDLAPCTGFIEITPAAGVHTVNVRLTAGAGTAQVNAGSGGAGNRGPILVTVERI